MSDDDWRVTVKYSTAAQGQVLAQALEAGRVDPGLLGHGVVISNESAEDELFLYAGEREFAERAVTAVQSAADAVRASISTKISRWHPVSERWEPADVALPADPESYAIERRQFDELENADSERLGHGAWDIRIRLAHRQDAIELSSKLNAVGLANVRRFRLVLLEASNEDAASALAEQVRPQLPFGALLDVAASPDEINLVESELPPPTVTTLLRSKIAKSAKL